MTKPPKFDRAKFDAHMNSLSHEQKQAAANKTNGCLLLVFLTALLGYCAFGADNESEVETTSNPSVSQPTRPAGGEKGEAGTTSAARPTVLGQALVDAPRGKGNAADYIKATINSKGYLCARIIDIVDAGSGQFGVGCILNQDGSGSANYLVAPHLDSVSKI